VSCSDLEYGLEVFTFYSMSWDFSIFLLIIIDVHRENTSDIFSMHFIWWSFPTESAREDSVSCL
jgi:hypothetical protein